MEGVGEVVSRTPTHNFNSFSEMEDVWFFYKHFCSKVQDHGVIGTRCMF